MLRITGFLDFVHRLVSKKKTKETGKRSVSELGSVSVFKQEEKTPCSVGFLRKS
jgi:hypothetical protein